jgi:hypothetical protein
MKSQQVPIAGGTQWRQNERLLAGGEGDNNRGWHGGNNSEFGRVALTDIAESTSLCQSFVVWFSASSQMLIPPLSLIPARPNNTLVRGFGKLTLLARSCKCHV